MWTAIVSTVKSFFVAVAGVLDYLQARDLKSLGAFEQEQLHIEEQRRNEALASEIDARPVPPTRHELLNGLRKPPASHG